MTFRGRVSDAELAAAYRDHDVIALPSITKAEAFGLVLLEGMASGCLPVASDLPGVRDVAGPTGVLVGAGDVAELRSVFQHLAKHPEERERRREASIARARSMPWARVAQQYEHTFRRSLSEVQDEHAVRALPNRIRNPYSFVDSLVRHFGASWGSLLLFAPASSSVRAAWGPVPLDAVRRREPKIAQHVARTGRPLLLDAQHEPDPELKGLLTRDDVRSALSVPIRTRRGTVAVLSLAVAKHAKHRFNQDHLEALSQELAG